MEFTEKDFAEVTAEKINRIADAKGREFARNIKTNQIRNFFAHINTIRNDFKNLKLSKSKNYNQLDSSLILVKPKLAYAVGRTNRNEKVHYMNFQQLINQAIDLTINTPEEKKKNAYENFFAFVEAIVAYHKYYGGQEN